ncbi:hypothetical protein [Clostridium saccharoperbutylacetonicum]|uniref:hypothetical protein n=1 Tax=Clostridium saccharoperbutylacetonicum TaxID=36745 RepID=UPI000983FBA2|nr:hypothetical protein [Clostridium saccharoperbutylacetonicum]AQR93523.1 hypothetical protein CLSAP_08290 [Clostridium saccharoperbutylacetonicum]NSB29221.1 hypothetical protein [Clostridium saccharoperbutylacetonicum]
MNKIQAKVYYAASTGQVLLVTSEMQGSVEKTTKEQDVEIYPQLKDKKVEEIDFIELEYGTLTSTFNNIKSYSIDVVNKKILSVYYTQEELDAIKFQQNKEMAEQQAIMDRTSTITNYIQDNTSIMDNVEDIILESEKNKILNGGM